jgi:hypothetical protein
MPQGKRGQQSAGRSGKSSPKTAAKIVPVKAAKRRAAEVVAKRPATKTAVKAPLKPRATEVVAKPVAKRKVAQPTSQKPLKRLATEIVAKPAKKRKANSVAKSEVESIAAPQVFEPMLEAMVELVAEEPAMVEPVVEPAAEFWNWSADIESVEPTFKPMADQWIAGREVESVVDLLTTAPVVEPIETMEPFETVTPPAESIAEQEAPSTAPESEPNAADSLFKPFVERRVTLKSLLERRLADPSAKERRSSDFLAKDYAAARAAERPAIAAAAKERRTRFAADAADLKTADPAANEVNAAPAFVDRRVADRRASGGVEADLRVRAQQNLFNETAVWMRKGGAVLIGLNVLLVIAVLILWHTRSSQGSEMTEMQKATMAEMRRATAASEVAAYASCLGSQTARSIMMQMKGGAVEQRLAAPSSGSALQTISATEAQAAQIQFNVEKTTSVDVHVPVLFHLAIENVGKSPALNAKVWGAVKVLDSSQEPDFKLAEPALSKEAIAPGDPAKVILYSADSSGLVIPLNDATYQQVKSGAAYVVAYGRVVYTDIFGVRHWAEFCHNITEPAGAGKHLNKCAAYNGAGVIDPIARPSRLPMPSQNASMTLPEISCQLPKQEKN